MNAKAIELNTNYDDEHHFYCQALDTIGKPHESIAEIQRALELDPLSIAMNMEMGYSLYGRGGGMGEVYLDTNIQKRRQVAV